MTATQAKNAQRKLLILWERQKIEFAEWSKTEESTKLKIDLFLEKRNAAKSRNK